MFNKYYINNLKKKIIDPQLIEKNKFYDFTSIKNVSINKSGNLLYCPNLVDKCHSTNRRNNMGDKLGLNCKFAESQEL